MGNAAGSHSRPLMARAWASPTRQSLCPLGPLNVPSSSLGDGVARRAAPQDPTLGGGLAPSGPPAGACARGALERALGALRGSRTQRLPRHRRGALGQDLGKATARQLVRREGDPRHGRPGKVMCTLLGSREGQPARVRPCPPGPRGKQTGPRPGSDQAPRRWGSWGSPLGRRPRRAGTTGPGAAGPALRGGKRACAAVERGEVAWAPAPEGLTWLGHGPRSLARRGAPEGRSGARSGRPGSCEDIGRPRRRNAEATAGLGSRGLPWTPAPGQQLQPGPRDPVPDLPR